jgi:hypothetical protein
MSGRTSGEEKRQQSPERCPKCGATENLTVAVTCAYFDSGLGKDKGLYKC